MALNRCKSLIACSLMVAGVQAAEPLRLKIKVASRQSGDQARAGGPAWMSGRFDAIWDGKSLYANNLAAKPEVQELVVDNGKRWVLGVFPIGAPRGFHQSIAAPLRWNPFLCASGSAGQNQYTLRTATRDKQQRPIFMVFQSTSGGLVEVLTILIQGFGLKPFDRIPAKFTATQIALSGGVEISKITSEVEASGFGKITKKDVLKFRASYPFAKFEQNLDSPSQPVLTPEGTEKMKLMGFEVERQRRNAQAFVEMMANAQKPEPAKWWRPLLPIFALFGGLSVLVIGLLLAKGHLARGRRGS